MFDSSKTNNKTLLTDCDGHSCIKYHCQSHIVKPWHQTLTYLVPSPDKFNDSNSRKGSRADTQIL